MIHYLPGTAGTLLATHGDAFDVLETTVPDQIAAFVLQATGKVHANTVAGIGAGLLLLGFSVLGLVSPGRQLSRG